MDNVRVSRTQPLIHKLPVQRHFQDLRSLVYSFEFTLACMRLPMNLDRDDTPSGGSRNRLPRALEGTQGGEGRHAPEQMFGVQAAAALDEFDSNLLARFHIQRQLHEPVRPSVQGGIACLRGGSALLVILTLDRVQGSPPCRFPHNQFIEAALCMINGSIH